MSVFGVNVMVSNLLHDWKRAQEKKNGNKTGTQQTNWCKPLQGWIKINVDATCREEYDYTRAGCIIRDDRDD